MDFDEAIVTHGHWRIRLLHLINGANRKTYDQYFVRLDSACDLGKWIHREASAFSRFPEYPALLQEHEAFHQSAAQVLRLSAAGKLAEATVTMKEGAFHQASLRTITASRELRLRIAA